MRNVVVSEIRDQYRQRPTVFFLSFIRPPLFIRSLFCFIFIALLQRPITSGQLTNGGLDHKPSLQKYTCCYFLIANFNFYFGFVIQNEITFRVLLLVYVINDMQMYHNLEFNNSEMVFKMKEQSNLLKVNSLLSKNSSYGWKLDHKFLREIKKSALLIQINGEM